MALIKAKTLDNGVTGNYWKIISSFLEYPNKVWITIGLFVSKAIREQGKEPLETEQRFYDIDINDPTRQNYYALLKTSLKRLVEKKDENGNTVFDENKKAVIEEVEINYLADAQDDI
jgi:hypothetical protein